MVYGVSDMWSLPSWTFHKMAARLTGYDSVMRARMQDEAACSHAHPGRRAQQHAPVPPRQAAAGDVPEHWNRPDVTVVPGTRDALQSALGADPRLASIISFG